MGMVVLVSVSGSDRIGSARSGIPTYPTTHTYYIISSIKFLRNVIKCYHIIL